VFDGQTYALKIIPKDSCFHILKAAYQEKKYLEMVDHSPFLVRLYGTFQDAVYLFLVMELVEGQDLRKCLENYQDRLTENEVKFITVQIIEALESMHNKRVLHRDIKPENIMMNEAGYLKLIDLGISSDTDSDGLSDAGSWEYMAPEGLENKKQTNVYDFYALGITVYELFEKKRPYKFMTKN